VQAPHVLWGMLSTQAAAQGRADRAPGGCSLGCGLPSAQAW